MFALWMFLACAGPKGGVDSGPPSPGDIDGGPAIGEPVTRLVLHEVFSGSNCGPCAPAAENMATALAGQEGTYSLLKYQLGSDPYITPEAISRRMLYLPGESSYSIPWVVADGRNEFHPNEMDDGEAYGTDDFEVLAAQPAYLAINVSSTTTGQTLDISVELWPTQDISGEDLRLFVAIKENTTENNIGSNGQTEFKAVLKKFVPDGDGTPIDALVAGTPSIHSFSYTFAGEYATETSMSSPVDHATAHTVEDFDDLDVVVWVQDMVTWEVFNSGASGTN